MIKTRPTIAPTMTLIDIERFVSHIKRADNGCWEWTGIITTTGYGEYHKGRHMLAHRVVLELINGELPPGAIPDHLCENTRCTNPEHLSIGSQADNVLRGRSFSAINAKLTHCKRGHEFTPGNIYMRPSRAWRECRACATIRSKTRNNDLGGSE